MEMDLRLNMLIVVYLDEVMTRSSKNGIIIQKMKTISSLEEAIRLTDSSLYKNKKILSDIKKIDSTKTYYVQDYSKQSFYYLTNQDDLNSIEIHGDDEISSLSSNLLSLLQIARGYAQPIDNKDFSARSRVKIFQDRINLKQVIITEL